MIESDYLIGRQEIADYAGVSTHTVTAMIKAGLRCIGGGRKGREPRSKPEWVDEFYESNPDFVARDYMVKKKK